jgi:hypothetical protein
MTKKKTLLVLMAVTFGMVMVLGAGIIGLSLSILKNPPEPVRTIANYNYVNSLSEDEKMRLIVDEVEKLDSVQSVDVTGMDWKELRIRVVTNQSQPDEVAEREITGVCNKGMQLWLYEPYEVTCTIKPSPNAQ